MLKIAGVILCVTGCTGYGYMKITEWKGLLARLNQWIFLVQKIKSRLLYQKETLEESCIRIGEKEEGELGKILIKIGKKSMQNRKSEFTTIWKEEMEIWCQEKRIPYDCRKLMILFPEYAKDADEDLQINLFALYLDELHQQKNMMETQMREKQKPVMAISLACGLMLSLLLM